MAIIMEAKMKGIAILLTAGAALTLLGGCAYQDGSYDGYYGGSGYGYNSRYRNYEGYGSRYGNRGYSGYYSPYSSYGSRSREHSQLHRDLGDAHGQAHDEGIYGRQDHAATHDALGDVHERWHEDRGY